jgi:hypothetical protein
MGKRGIISMELTQIKKKKKKKKKKKVVDHTCTR